MCTNGVSHDLDPHFIPLNDAITLEATEGRVDYRRSQG